MRLSFEDEESFKEAVGSLNFNKPLSDSDSVQQVGSSISSMPPERKEDICCDNPPSDSNIILEVRRVPVGSSSTQPHWQESEDTEIY